MQIRSTKVFRGIFKKKISPKMMMSIFGLEIYWYCTHDEIYQTEIKRSTYRHQAI